MMKKKAKCVVQEQTQRMQKYALSGNRTRVARMGILHDTTTLTVPTLQQPIRKQVSQMGRPMSEYSENIHHLKTPLMGLWASQAGGAVLLLAKPTVCPRKPGHYGSQVTFGFL